MAAAVELDFRWEPVPARVELRPRSCPRKLVRQAAAEGNRVLPEERHKALTYSFAAVRELLPAEPGIYLVEAFHAAGYFASESPDQDLRDQAPSGSTSARPAT